MLLRIRTFLTVAATALSLFSASTDARAQSVAKVEKTAKLPSALDVFKKSVEAMGGREKLSSIKSQVAKGTVTIPQAGLNGDISTLQGENGEFLVQVSIPGVMNQESGSDGKTIWESSNVTGTEILSGVRADQLKLQMTLFTILEPEKTYDSVECAGKEMFAGEECYAVVTKKGKLPPTTTYYSVSTGLEKGSRVTAVTGMGEMKIVSEVKSYRQQDGVKFADEAESTFPNGMKQIIKITEIEFNSKIDPEKFNLPKEVAIKTPQK